MPVADLTVAGNALVDGELAPRLVVVADGGIEAVVPIGTPVESAEHVDLAEDEVLIPGLVDSHVHVNEPGRTEWEGFASATRAAAAGGVTTILDMPLNSVPATIDPSALELKRRSADHRVHVDVGFWGGAVPASLGRLGELHAEGVFGFKCFLVDSGVPEFPPLTRHELDRGVAEIAALDALLIVHAEDSDVLAGAPGCSGPSYAGFVASRPHAAEEAAIATLLESAARHRARVHVVHLSSAAALPALAAARAAGVAVTVETCPHYLVLSQEEIPDGRTEFKCCPPIRGAANQDALWQGLLDGLIDCVVSDHSPSTPDLKCLDSGDLGAAWGGIASLQLGLPLVWSAAATRNVPLETVVHWMSTAPAELAGLTTKGRLAPGCDADLVVLAPDETFVVDPALLHHRSPVTPYLGRRLQGVVRQVWLRGRQIVNDGKVEATPAGRLLRRERA